MAEFARSPSSWATRLTLVLVVGMLWGCQNTPGDSSSDSDSPSIGSRARAKGTRTKDKGTFDNHASPLRLAEIEAVRERLRRERQANPNVDLPSVDDEDAECAHVWEQIGSHPWRKPGMGGVPMMAMCAISRCTKCGKIRHECQQKRRTRRK